jgi:hypothetical protein
LTLLLLLLSVRTEKNAASVVSNGKRSIKNGQITTGSIPINTATSAISAQCVILLLNVCWHAESQRQSVRGGAKSLPHCQTAVSVFTPTAAGRLWRVLCHTAVCHTLQLVLYLTSIIHIQSVPRSKHTPSRLYKPVS